MDKLCAWPWNALAVRPNGQTIPCCRFIGELDDWQKLRQDFIDNKTPSSCSACFSDEEKGKISLRQQGFKNLFPVPKTNDEGDLLFLEVAFSNLCNLACMHCNEYFSTKWQSENIKNGRTTEKGIKSNTFDISRDLSKVKYLKLIGGEPLLEQERMLDVLNQVDINDCTIQICTNGTVFPEERLQEKIDQSKNTLIVVSIEGLEKVNEWMRWPSQWSKVESIIKQYDDKWGQSKNVHLHFHCCINIYNIFYLDDIVDYVMNKKYWKIEWDWVEHPPWYALSVFPDNIKEMLETKLSNKIVNDTLIEKFCGTDPYQVSVKKLQSMPNASWKRSLKTTYEFAKERNLDVESMIPRFFENVLTN